MVAKVLVTGGAGFIGSALVRHVVRDRGVEVVNVDALTYAGNPDSLAEIAGCAEHRFEHVDIRDRRALERVFREHRPEAVMHLAAESHVDRSIDGPGQFVDTNLAGTAVLLEVARAYWQELSEAAGERFRFHHISTDEVYGSLGHEGRFHEDMAYDPSSPYSATKAGSDHLVRAWHRTYGLPVVLTNCSNNYGPYQFPEKLIPLMILNGSEGHSLPVYGDGSNVRDWLFVDDHVEALWEVLNRGAAGETYHIGGACERSNLEVVRAIARELDEQQPRSAGSHAELIRFVPDRPGHDFRYAMDITKIHRELGWWPTESFESGLRKTVRWYLDNRQWVARVQAGDYRRERLGLGGVER